MIFTSFKTKIVGISPAMHLFLLLILTACIAIAHFTSYQTVEVILGILTVVYAIALDVLNLMINKDGLG